MILSNVNIVSNASILISFIAREYFFHYYCVLQFTNELTVNHASLHGNYLVSSTVKFGEKDVNKYDKCMGIVIYSSENPRQTFDMFETFIKVNSKNDLHERKYIIRFNSSQQNEFNDFFASKNLKYVADILIVKELEEDQFALYTHTYIGLEENEGSFWLNEWNFSSGFKLNTSLFPDKLSNQFGKKLIVGGKQYLPITDPDNLKGPETRILIEYSKKNNLTLVFNQSFNYLGDLRPNWTGSGYMGLILEDKIDLISYAVYIQKDRKDYGDFAYPNCEIRVTCLVPKPKLINQWMIIKIFAYSTWFLIVFSMFVVMATFKIIQSYIKWLDSSNEANQPFQYLVVYRLFLGQPCDFNLQTQLERLLISLLLVCVILIQTFFNSKLSSFITVPNYIDDINTLQDLANSDIKWYSKYNDKGKIIRDDKTEPMISIYNKFRHITTDDLSSITDSSYGYAVDESFTSHYFTIDDYFTFENLQDFKVMKEYIIGHQYTAFFLRRNSILMSGINTFCHRSLEHGLIKNWERNSLSNYAERKLQEYLALSSIAEKPLIKLDVKLLIGVFSLWCTGIVISCLVFLLEYFGDRHYRTY